MDNIFLEATTSYLIQEFRNEKVKSLFGARPSKNNMLIQSVKDINNDDNDESKNQFMGNLLGYDIKDRVSTCPIVDSDTNLLRGANKCNILFLKPKNKDYYVIPIIQITKSEKYYSLNSLISGVMNYSFKVVSKIYDLNIYNCCRNPYFLNKKYNFFIFPLARGEWSGKPKKIHPLFADQYDKMIWIDVVKCIQDKKYADDFVFTESTANTVNSLLYLINKY